MNLGDRRRVRCADEHEEITVHDDSGDAEWEASNLRARGLRPEQLREEIRVMLRAGRGVLPLLVAAERVAPDVSHAVTEHAKTDDEGFHRLWATALFCRTLDGYDAVLRRGLQGSAPRGSGAVGARPEQAPTRSGGASRLTRQ
jgi:hypothetical protein